MGQEKPRKPVDSPRAMIEKIRRECSHDWGRGHDGFGQTFSKCQECGLVLYDKD